MNVIKSTPLLGLLLLTSVLPASAQQNLGAVVCVASETETLATTGPVRRVILKDTEVVYRVGVRLADQEEVEAGLLAELSGSGEARCVRSEREHSHVVVVSYQGVVQQDLTIDPEDPRYPAFAVGYGTSWEEAEQYATRWDACVSAGGCYGYEPDDEGWGRGRRPVVNVSLGDVWGYVEWLSGHTGEEYRPLSEAEWEYVARAGTETARYWGESEFGQCRYANGDGDDVPCADGHEYTAPVGSYWPNAFGLYDVLGNVMEWTVGCRTTSYSGAPADGSTWHDGDCSIHGLRGGSWNNNPRNLRSAARLWARSGHEASIFGFRVARTVN